MNVLRNGRLWVGIILLIAFISIPFLPQVQHYLSIPNEVVTLNNQTPISLPELGEHVEASTEDNSMLAVDSSQFYVKEAGESEVIYKAGGIPVKKVNVSAYEDIKVIPGGQSVGIQLQSRGVLVVGHHLVHQKGEQLSPGEDAKVEVGDVILEINDKEIKKMEDVKPYVEEAGKKEEPLHLKIKRGKETITTTLSPVKDDKDNEYRIGLYIRDSAAGIGTMSFYDPKSLKYGALGHVISDMDTKKPIDINDGTVVKSKVTSIEKGGSGTPGEKQAKFSIKENKIGNITKNSPFGIFGELNEGVKNGKMDEPMSIGLSHEVEEGPAKILTVVEDEKVEAFDIEIVSTVPQKFPATKGMVIKVTDEKLLEKTGGIVQGMSGSPIIQNDKIVGAVTHVFVNDPKSGYGVHIEWMLQEAGIISGMKKDKAS